MPAVPKASSRACCRSMSRFPPVWPRGAQYRYSYRLVRTARNRVLRSLYRTNMQYRKLGRTGFEVSDIGYGAWCICGKQWLGGQDDESLAALRLSIERGVNLIDTALAYGDGHSEKLVGQVVRKADRKIYVATKVPPKNRTWPAKGAIGEVFPYDYIMACAEESLRNLKLDSIDLLQLHVWSAEWTPRDEWRRALEDLKRSGKVRFVGVSATEHDPDSTLSVIETGLIDAVQVIYNV